MKIKIVLALLLLPFSFSSLMAQHSSGPRKGALILSGGAISSGGVTPVIIKRFVSLAGGPDANFVFIPTASSGIKLDSGFIYTPPDSDNDAVNTREFEQELSKFFGINRITVLHTRNRNTADSEAFIEVLRKATGVWLSEGNAGRLAQVFLDTSVPRELERVLERGGVIGGNSAGAIIQGSYIVRGRPDKPLLMAKGHERGFGFLKNVVINPHLTSNNRFDELVNVVDAHTELLGIGIDDKAAIVVQGDQFEVIGEGRVAIYEDKKHDSKWYYWLTQGTLFDLRARAVKSAPESKKQ
jgi:cyanophycinase